MRRMRLPRKASIGLAALLVGATAFTFGAAKIAHASNDCYFTTYTHPWYDIKNLADGNYIDMTSSFEQIPASGCTQWAGHDWGDMYVIQDYQLGSTADFFNNNQGSGLRVEGWDTTWYGTAYPGGPNYFSDCAIVGVGWTSCTGVPWDIGQIGAFNAPYYLGGTNGNTNLEVTSTEQTYSTLCDGNFDSFGNANANTTLVISNQDVTVPTKVYDEPVGWTPNNDC